MFLYSSILADLRLKNIINSLKNKNVFKNKIILDSGCGPGRYIVHLLKYNPKRIIGIDSGKDIIKNNKIRFKKFKKIKFIHSKIDHLPLSKESVDFVISAGVLHHTKTSIIKLIEDHARVIKPKGYFFIFIVSNKGQELELWNFCRKVMKNINIKYAFNFLKNKIHPLRLQGFLDHSYGEYKLTSKEFLLKVLKKNFSSVQELQGIKGADVTKNNFPYDKYFKKRFGCGNLRFICVK
jgi:ubiquinone/menaquinone biosynthesis C-methylase UbiE